MFNRLWSWYLRALIVALKSAAMVLTLVAVISGVVIVGVVGYHLANEAYASVNPNYCKMHDGSYSHNPFCRSN